MEQEMILCIPGPWASRSEFLGAIITTEPSGEFIFAGGILTHAREKDFVLLTYEDSDPRMSEAFRVAGQGKISEATLQEIDSHAGVAYLHFPIDLPGQRERVIKFTDVVRRAGGIAIKVESSGVAHQWDRWSYLLTGEEFDLYCSVCLLVGDETHFYSCGMHHFGAPECSVPSQMDVHSAADLINQFNLFQIVDRPRLATGHTFSTDSDSPSFRLALEEDQRHEPDDLFHNPHGLWVLTPRE
ncbi:hypothetical protein OKA05_18215 [Luteolibacter arcticus]|uniref:DUF4261 domain-containing protein n=1 Tax=Luteolibacter arcticus TaxID=1581411 RepID=A0ABT3GM09_9BACT|nr:hypothetical protein [Luteolibacter arcticus]MCW1924506.1 hypothetical protein [Luteolibacter arcticus]